MDNVDAYAKLDKTGLEGQYVVIIQGEVVAKGENIKEMLEQVKQEYPEERPFVAKVPEKRMLVLSTTPS